MDERLIDLYHLPDIGAYEDYHLLTLREQCLALEEQVYALLTQLPDKERQIIEVYLDMRNELEFQSVKTALRYGRRSSRT